MSFSVGRARFAFLNRVSAVARRSSLLRLLERIDQIARLVVLRKDHNLPLPVLELLKLAAGPMTDALGNAGTQAASCKRTFLHN